MILFLTSLAILASAIYTYFNRRSTVVGKNIPFVKGCYPIVGHGITFSKDIIGFVRRCYNDYGKIFRIKVFNRNMVVICDRSMIDEFFKAKEETFSLYDVLTDLFFADAFSDDPSSLSTIINIVKRTISIRFDEVVPKIKEEADRMIERLKDTVEDDNRINIASEMIRFVACTSSRCFVGVELDDYVYDLLMRFTHKLNKLVVLTYFLPRSVLRFIAHYTLRPLRKQMVQWLIPEIQKYRLNPSKNDSMILREGVDYVSDSGKKLTDDEIGDIVVCLLYVSSENTALGLSASVIDLANHHDSFLTRAKREAYDYLNRNDMKGLFSSAFIDSCVMESARMNTHIFALNRKPHGFMIDGYSFDGVDCVALCEPMLMLHEASTDKFSNPLVYNPDRYSKPMNESKAANSVMTWGAGVHLCPGKMFALYEIKTALALIITNFHIDCPDELPPLDYFSPSAFSERSVELSLTPINMSYESNAEVYEEDGIKCYLVRNYYTSDEANELLDYTLELSEYEMPIRLTEVRPLAFDNLVYTRQSNCKPTRWYEEAKQITSSMNGLVPSSLSECNSMYSQIFMPLSSMQDHKDEYVDWGISVSFGMSAVFVLGKQKITLNHGDVLITDFSKVQHGIHRLIQRESDETLFRCSVQLRKITTYPDTIKTMNEFIEMIN